MSNKKIKKTILIIIFILLFILIGIYRLTINLKEQQKNYSVHDLETPIVSSKNLVQDAYKGRVDTLEISNRVRILFEQYLPLVAIDAINYSDEELKVFYEEEAKHGLIYLNMGIDNYDDFKKFMNELSQLKCDLTNIETVEYDENSYVQGKNEDSIEFEISYNNGNNVLKCKAYIPKNKKDDENLIVRFEILEVINK